MTTFTGNPGQNDTFVGANDAPDTFNFAALDLTAGDILTGGTGVTVDLLRFTTSGTVSASAFAQVSGIEQVILANGTNSLTLTDALVGSASGTLLSVVGGTGNDTVDGTGVTTATNRLSITAGAGIDTLKGGAGADIFRFAAADLTGSDTVQGGDGASLDQLVLTTAGTVAAAAFAKVSGIEQLTLASGTNAVTLTDAMIISANGRLLSVIGGTGNDTVDGTGVANVLNRLSITAGAGIDTLRGGAAADIFRFAAADLTTDDTVQGGDGARLDALQISTAGTIAAAAFAKVSGIEQIVLANGTNNVTLADAMVGSANGAMLTVTGGTGNDTVDGTGVTTATNKLDFTAGTGNDTLKGGAGADAFRIAATELTTDDTIQGGGGTSLDRLVLTTAGTTAVGAFSKVSGIEQLTLANGTNAVTLTDAMVGSANGALLTVTGSTGNDTVDGSAVTTAANKLDITAGTGNDTLKGGAGADLFRISRADLTSDDTIQGGGGASVDRILFTTSGTLAAAAFTKVSGIEQLALSNGANNVTLTDALVGSANGALLSVVGGTTNDTIDGTAVTTAANRLSITAGTGIDTLKGGAGADAFRFAAADLTTDDTVQGGGGASIDQLVLNTAGTVAAAAFTKVSGIEQIVLASGTNAVTLTDAMVGSANNTKLIVTGASGDDTVDGTAVTTAINKLDITAGTGNDTLKGGAGADTFRFDAPNLNGSDTVNGGGGSDVIVVSGAGTVAGGLAGVSNIEQITINGTGGVSLSVSNAAALANAATLAVVSGAGSDTVDGSAITDAGRALSITAGSGNDTLKGGAGADTFGFAIADLTSSDSVQGGAGASIDTLQFSTAGTIAGTLFAGVSGVERLQLANGTNNLTVTDALAGSATGKTLQVTGGTGNDTVNASAVTTAANAVDITAGAGNDALTGGNGADTFRFDPTNLNGSDTVQGGGGASLDTLALSAAGTVAAASFAGVSGIERLQLANGTNTVTLSNALVGAANATTLAVIGGTGSDTVNASAVTTAANIVDFTAGTGSDSFTGGAGNDIVRFDVAGLDATDTVNGGSGFDTLVLSGAGAVAAAALGGVSNFERITLGSSGISLSISNAVALANAATLSVLGTSGNDTVDGSAITDAGRGLSIVAGSGNDTLKGGAGADQFGFSIADLNGSDTVQGGGGASTDQLVFITAGTLNTTSLPNVSGIERIVLANGTNFVTLSNALVSSAANTTVSVIGGTGDDLVNASTVSTTANKVDFTLGSGNDTFSGGLGADTVRVATAELSGLDSINGGSGLSQDTLLFTNAGTIDLTVLTSVSQIEQIKLFDGPNTLTVSDDIVGNASNTTLTVTGGTGADSVNLMNVTTASRTVIVNTGAGADTVTLGTSSGVNFSGDLGSESDTLKSFGNYDQSTINGGLGTDTVEFDYYYTSDITMAAGLTGFEIVNLTDTYPFGGNPYVLNFQANDTAGLVVNGAFAGDQWVIRLGAGGQTANGNALSDTLIGGSGADSLNGNGGNDLIVYAANDLNAAGGAGTGDRLVSAVGGTFNLSNAADQSSGDTNVVTGFENVSLLGDGYGGSEAGLAGTVTGSSGANLIDGSDQNDVLDGNGGLDTISGWFGTDRITYRGTEAALYAIADGYGQSDENDVLVLRAAVQVDLNQVDQTQESSGNNVLVTGFNSVDASAVNESVNINGNDYANTVVGSTASDIIDTGAGDDTVTYDGLDAFVEGGSENFNIGDTLVVKGAATVNLNDGTGDQVTSDAAGFHKGFENVDASLSAAVVSLTGRSDFYSSLMGGNANDTITAGAAGATIVGGGGADTMTGGIAEDRFVLLAGNSVAGESINGGDAYDRIFVNATMTINGTVSNVEEVNLAEGITLTISGAIAAGLTSLYSNDFEQDNTEAVIINVASGTTADLRSLTLNTFDATDTVTVNGAAGGETIYALQGKQTVNAAGGADTIYSFNAAEGSVLNGDAGNDRIAYYFYSAPLTLDGGADSDTLFDDGVYSTDLTIDLSNTVDQTGSDTNVVRNFENVDWSASAYALNANGSSGANTIKGGSGYDTIVGGAGADTLEGNDGDDTITYDGIDVSISAGSGGESQGDKLIILGAATLILGSGATDQSSGDTAVVTGFENIDASGSNASVFMTGRGDFASTLIGGSAADTITAGDAGATITGGGGGDTLVGGGGDDTFIVNAGHYAAGESVDGNGGYDRLNLLATVSIAGPGTVSDIEELNIGSGATVTVDASVFDFASLQNIYSVDGSATTETLIVNANATNAVVDLTDTNVSFDSAGDSLTINGGSGKQSITGTNAKDTINGNDGDDVIYGGGASSSTDDSINGGAGNDTIGYFNGGLLEGGADSDTLVRGLQSYDSITINLSRVNADQTDSDSANVRNFENVDFSSDPNSSLGTVNALGSNSANTLIGGLGDDTLSGAGGADTLDGREGVNSLTGGAGTDTFRFSARFTGNEAFDTITDFSSADDTLAFNSSLYTANSTGGAGFDSFVGADNGTWDLTGVDVVRYTGGLLNSTFDVQTYLSSKDANTIGDAGQGLFILGTNGSSRPVLYHTTDASGATGDITAVAMFSNSPAFNLGDFTFIA